MTEQVGSAAEEAARLLAALQDWAHRSADGSRQHIATGAPECRLCPCCTLLSLLRDSRPEVFGHLADAASAAVAAVRALVETHERDWVRRSGGGIEHIDIG